MVNDKLRYYADFIIYAALLLALLVFTSRRSPSAEWIWAVAAGVGLVGWTLIEYVLHRFVFHRAPVIADLHHAHHIAPRAYLATPTWVSLLVLGLALFAPIWRLLTLQIAFGAITGVISGWLWYGVVHHVIHHRRPRWLANTLRATSRRHFQHHHVESGNYGVTTAVWDCLFGTDL